MDWVPIEVGELESLVSNAFSIMETPARALWSLLRVRPTKWRLSPWGDQGGGFWVVGILGEQVIWFNDIEWGFNVSTYERYGEIGKYWCNQDELQHTMYALLRQLASGETSGRFGPPMPLDLYAEPDAAADRGNGDGLPGR